MKKSILLIAFFILNTVFSQSSQDTDSITTKMNPEEVLLLRNWDSSVCDHSCYAAHTGFKSPIVPTQSKPRESIELRTLLVFSQ